MSDECLEVFNVHELNGNPIEMQFHPDRAIIDLRPLLNDAFKNRDRQLGPPPYQRFDKNSSVYKFSLVEIIEAFCWKFTPIELGSYLGSHLTRDTEQSDIFVKRFKKTRLYTDILAMRFYRKSDAHNARGHYFLEPVSCKADEVCKFLGKKMRGKDFTVAGPTEMQEYKKILPGFHRNMEDTTAREIKEIFMSRERPTAIVVPFYIWLVRPKLHDVHVAVEYKLPVEGLELVRKNIKS